MASKRHVRIRACKKKRTYTRTEAINIGKRLRTTFNEPSYAAYLCKFCHGWHVGRRNKARTQSAKAKARNATADSI